MPLRRSHYSNRALWASLLVSLLVHLAVLYLVRDFRREEVASEAFRARLALVPPQFKPRRLAVSQKVELPQVEMEYLEAGGQARAMAEEELSLAPSVPRLEEAVAPGALRELAMGAKEDVPHLERQRMLSPSELGPADSLAIVSMDLLRLVDLARANKEHAAVIPNLGSRQDLAGYINFTQLRLYGAGSGRGELDALARYLRDHTRLLARVRDQTYEYFLSENLLKDPVHFLFEGGGLIPYRSEVLTQLSEEEKTLMGRYLREGGFFFIEGRNRYLREMVGHLRSILGDQAQLKPVSTAHLIYHSFYGFGGGFPGEDKQQMADVGDNPSWYYPVQNREVAPAAELVSFFNPLAAVTEEERLPPPLGLWGVELNGELVAVLSDLELHDRWRDTTATEGEDEPVLYSLMAGTNILVYALMRAGGTTPKLPPPAWAQTRPESRVQAALQEPDPDQLVARADELFDHLDASLALVQSPLGSLIQDDVLVRLDGRYSLELLRRDYHGLLLHNLPAGPHWIELRYAGKSQQLEVDLQGGKVLTVTFALNRLAFVKQLRLGQQEKQVGVGQWLQGFSDLEIEQVYIGEDGEWLERDQAF
jgi:hypothetical protein